MIKSQRTSTLKFINDWWSTSTHDNTRYFKCTEYIPADMLQLTVEGIEDPSALIISFWKGPLMFCAGGDALTTAVIYKDDKYLAVIYDYESVKDILDQTGEEIIILEVLGQLNE